MKNSIFFTLFTIIFLIVIYGGVSERQYREGLEQQKLKAIDRDSLREIRIYNEFLKHEKK